MMTDRQLNNRVQKIKEAEAKIKELETHIKGLKEEIQEHLTEAKEDEHNTGDWMIRWKLITSSRLDTDALKTALPDVYKTYSKSSSSRRFTINKAS
ncbi:MAG: hypothetical protein IJE78_05880 [Bacteroidaceae bacterium]|nr:hypothetical protein [Bacteroidaceae bacterium]